jgi:hypothetical protein
MKSRSHSAVGVTAFSPSVDAGPSTECGSLQAQESKDRASILVATYDKATVEQQALATFLRLMASHWNVTEFITMDEEAMNLHRFQVLSIHCRRRTLLMPCAFPRCLSQPPVNYTSRHLWKQPQFLSSLTRSSPGYVPSIRSVPASASCRSTSVFYSHSSPGTSSPYFHVSPVSGDSSCRN